MGARLTPVAGAPVHHDVDVFDDFCEHLLVRTTPRGGQPPEVVGTYRVLTPSRRAAPAASIATPNSTSRACVPFETAWPNWVEAASTRITAPGA
jgi:hypothetical protein